MGTKGVSHDISMQRERTGLFRLAHIILTMVHMEKKCILPDEEIPPDQLSLNLLV